MSNGGAAVLCAANDDGQNGGREAKTEAFIISWGPRVFGSYYTWLLFSQRQLPRLEWNPK